MPSRGYIAGKPVSRWEAADSDNIDIEYKNLDRPGRQPWARCGSAECFTGPKGLVLKALLLALLFCLGLIFGYLVRKGTCALPLQPVQSLGFVAIQQNYNDKVRQELQARIGHTPNFNDSIFILGKKLPLSGVGQTNELLFYMRDFWKTEYLDAATIRNYTVQLMYPNYTLEGVNRVSLMSGNETLFVTHTNDTNIHPNYLPFCAFSHSGHVRGSLVYGHYGRKEDFTKLKQVGVDVNGTIVLIRYGKIHPSNKVYYAEKLGALGVIFYPDPQDYVDTEPGGVQPDVSGTWWLPGDAVIRSSVRYWLTGDPLTPDYPAVDGVPRVTAERDSYPRLPVFPISYNDAQRFMVNMSGLVVPEEWRGGLNVPYKTGPGFLDEREVDLNVKNEFLFREIHNIIATIYGQYEKDQYVIVGAHIDSLTTGAIDAGTGYAVLNDLVRTFSQQKRGGWRPRRTIIFAGWDASKFGHYGAFEWAQEYEQQLFSGAVTYINLDAAVRGNYSFYAEASPLLYDVLYAATKSVEFTNDQGIQTTVYEDWKSKLSRPDFSSENPWVSDLPGDSDHSPFLYRLGVSSMSTAFTYNIKEYSQLPNYPVYGTLDDTLDYFHTYIDPDFNMTTALTRVLCDIVLRLSDSALLPFNVTGYESILQRGVNSLRNYTKKLEEAQIKFDLLVTAVRNFTKAAAIFHTNYTNIDLTKTSEFEVRFLNDKMIQVSRAFIHTGGVMSQPWYRNILVAPHPDNLNEEVVFPGIITTLLKADSSSDSSPLAAKDDIVSASVRANDFDRPNESPADDSGRGGWKDEVRKQFAIVVVCLQRARTILLESYPADSFNDSW